MPASDSDADDSASKRARDFSLGWFAEPIFFGNYPNSMIEGIANRSAFDGYIKTRLPKFTRIEQLSIKGTTT